MFRLIIFMAMAKKRLARHDKKLKFLIVFYSRTGTIKRLAEAISIVLKCDLEEIREPGSRSGLLGYLRSGKEAAWKEMPRILKPIKNPKNYDVVIIGTPVWSATVSSPVRSYMYENKDKFKRVAFFSSCDVIGGITFHEMARLCRKKPLAALEMKTFEIRKGGYIQKINEFVKKIEEAL